MSVKFPEWANKTQQPKEQPKEEKTNMTETELLAQIVKLLEQQNAKLDRANDQLETLIAQAGLLH